MKRNVFWPGLFLPATLSLVAIGFLGDDTGSTLRFALVGIGVFSVSTGFWTWRRAGPEQASRLGVTLAMAGSTFAANLFILFLGCAAPSSGNSGGVTFREHRVDASSRKEMAKVASQIPKRNAGLTPEALDLTPYYNATLTEDWRTKVGAVNLTPLPVGPLEVGGITFDVRGVIRTCSQPKEDDGRKFPVAVDHIKVDRLCQRLHFLHGFGWDASRLTPVATWVIHYADGKSVDVPVVYGRDVLSSWSPSGLGAPEARFVAAGGKVAWEKAVEAAKTSPAGSKTVSRLFLTTWQNPRPTVKIDALDLKSNPKIFATPFLVALTVDFKN